MKDTWEAMCELYDYNPNIDKHFCLVCNHKTKTVSGIWRHIQNNHITEIIEIRHKSIKLKPV